MSFEPETILVLSSEPPSNQPAPTESLVESVYDPATSIDDTGMAHTEPNNQLPGPPNEQLPETVVPQNTQANIQSDPLHLVAQSKPPSNSLADQNAALSKLLLHDWDCSSSCHYQCYTDLQCYIRTLLA